MEFYHIYHDKEGNLTYADDGDEDVSFVSELFDEPLTPQKVELDLDNCLMAYFYYNDMEDYTTADAIYFNSEEHLDAYYENHNGDGHYSLDRIETWKNGKLVDTKMVCDRVSYA